jgi:hypothetical protein
MGTSQANEHPAVIRGAWAGTFSGGGIFYLQYPSLGMEPTGAVFFGAIVGLIAGSSLGYFITNKDDKVRGFFRALWAQWAGYQP